MSLVDGGRIAAANVGFKAVFDGTLATANDLKLARLLATWVESNSSEETYNWLGPTPGLLEWVDDRVVMKLRAHGYTIKNRRWAVGLEVEETDYADDKLGIIGLRIQGFAKDAAAHYVKLLVDLLKGGFTTLCYDGQYFFDTNHKDGTGPVQSNKQTGMLTQATYNQAFQKMQEIQNENGDPVGATPTHLVVGPALRATALEIIQSEVGAAGATNVNFKSTELYVAPRLSGADALKWFLLDLSKPVGPLILQIRQPLLFSALDQASSYERWIRGKYLYGMEGRHSAGYGLWQYAVGSTGV